VRVIAGTAGGLQLKVPRSGVRPTMDRVKAAIFSSLGEKVIGARVLDLFAGAGGLGIEALSRGAASAVFVESNRNAARTIERNLAIAGVGGRVRARDAFEYLKYATGPFDIIFADPPYEATPGAKAFTDLLLNNPRIPPLLVSDGVFVLEKRPGERLPTHPHWKVVRARHYGATEVIFAEHQR
jgi:16S rRNA (guanine966-N2)-methyltransferase